MYQIRCDGYVLYDPRDDDFVVTKPKCKLGINIVGEASFTINATHPHYNYIKKLRSVFEILQDGTPIFRGRMTDDSRDFDNSKFIDIEGALAFLNDSIVPPFVFPDDFAKDSGYIEAAASGNVVKFFLGWLIEQHNENVLPFQRFKLGNVTVADPNNYLSRSSEEYAKTWEIVKTRLFNSALGGYLCIRYEPDGNYIDYLADFETVNTQKIVFGENLLDIVQDSDAVETYSAVMPLGMRKSEIDKESKDKTPLTIEDLPDGILQTTEEGGNIIKKGKLIYSKKAVEEYGFICAPPSETTWDDVSNADNLLSNGVDFLLNTAIKLMNTITIKAVDLCFSDEEIEAFRIYRNILVESAPHGLKDAYKLEQLDIDIESPQNTVITIGDSQLSLTDINAGIKQNIASNAEKSTVMIQTQVKEAMSGQTEDIYSNCEKIVHDSMGGYVSNEAFQAHTHAAGLQMTGFDERLSGVEQGAKNYEKEIETLYDTIAQLRQELIDKGVLEESEEG